MIFAHILTDKSVLTVKISTEERLDNRQKESSQKLPQVKTTTEQDSIHPITVFPRKVISIQPMI